MDTEKLEVGESLLPKQNGDQNEIAETIVPMANNNKNKLNFAESDYGSGDINQNKKASRFSLVSKASEFYKKLGGKRIAAVNNYDLLVSFLLYHIQFHIHIN